MSKYQKDQQCNGAFTKKQQLVNNTHNMKVEKNKLCIILSPQSAC